MSTKRRAALQAVALALALTLGSLAAVPAGAQEETQPVAAEEDNGFDDWGLLGLLGLLGLAGLRRREPEVRTVEPTRAPRR